MSQINFKSGDSKLPRIGLFVCFSGGSNSGTLTGMAAFEVVRRLGEDKIGICSLPATLQKVSRQFDLVKQFNQLMVVDGCHHECTRKLLGGIDIFPDSYINLETDLHYIKKGPFSSMDYTVEDVNKIADAIIHRIKESKLLN